MQTEKFVRIFKIAAAVIIFLSLDQNIEEDCGPSRYPAKNHKRSNRDSHSYDFNPRLAKERPHVYRKQRNGQPWHIRGVDVFTVRNGKVAAKLAYVKG